MLERHISNLLKTIIVRKFIHPSVHEIQIQMGVDGHSQLLICQYEWNQGRRIQINMT